MDSDYAPPAAAPNKPRRPEDFRAAWGRPVVRPRNFDLITLFHRWSGAASTVDDNTWSDLGMDEVFATLDRTVSVPGRQVLYHRLRTYAPDAATLAERARQQEIFQRDPALRESLQVRLARLDHPNAEYIAPLLLGEMPAPPPAAGLLQLLSLLTPVCLVGMFFVHPLFIVALLLVCTNAVIYATYGQRIAPHFSGFSQINSLLGTAAALAQLPDQHALPQLARLRERAPLIATLRKRLGPLVMDRLALPDLAQSAFGYLNMFFLLDIVAFLRATRVLRDNQRTLAQVFEDVGSLDAAIAVASYRTGLAVVTTPTLTDRREIDATGLYHPLIPDAVANPFALSGHGALIAGPNMAGKTAFIRTVGINLILAQTLHLCLAERAVLPRARVRSAIRREDKLSDGSSYFFAEIKQVLEFTQAGAEAPLHLFLIDEIFRGTNTVERIASSSAVLRHLARHHLVFATTHDLELQEMLGDTFAMYHFSDQVSDGAYGFDYRIHPGPVRSRNAIKLLEISGYSPAIIAEAEALAARLDAQRYSRPATTPAPASPPPASDTP